MKVAVKPEAVGSDDGLLLNGLSRRKRTFILEKLVGLNDKDAALAAGYSLSMAENTKQKVWKPEVKAEFQRLSEALELRTYKLLLAKLEAQEANELRVIQTK